ncbi:toxic anion resistance protein [Pseudoflavonifractor phocaeensis]|uniref:toxic anion resistance protein n=1 Tax=Pseudoflavonifractor phocaeensis TaxID=1870988 RepID=UPI0021091896|nr:toxic anion resistance protein [Pseudoflavonifractor phocaeensis]MCQ4864116.1 toxic anion resistance protein [Pseudoflavonifractor phocaeensis]
MALQYTPRQDEIRQAPAPMLEEPQPFDVAAQRQEMNQTLVGSAEVDALVSQICVNDPQTIVSFGGEVAGEIAKCSDTILNSINMSQVNDSGALLNTLGRIMDKFDIEEIAADERKGVLGRLFGNLQKQLDQILAKYHTMGEEVDKIYIELKKYEVEIGESNKKLQAIYDANVRFYQDLVKYILAGEQGLAEMDAYLAQMQSDLAQNPGDTMLQLDYGAMQQARTILDQRVMDLRIAENVAMQSIPMIQSMQFSNLNLIRKINSAFIITLPVFKQALTQAVLLKRQKIQAQAMEALDQRTNEMLLKNAKNTADQTKLTAQLASSSSIKIETLEQTWKTIVSGIEETQKIQSDAAVKRTADAARLSALKDDFQARVHV